MSRNPKLEAIPGPLRVAIVADDPLVRTGLASVLSAWDELELCELPEQPDVVLWDAGAGADDHQDADAVAELERCGVPTLALVGDDADASAALAAGARGVMQREVGGAGLHAALQAVQYGLTVLDPSFAALAAPPPAAPEPEPLEQALTARELEVLEHVAAGLSNKRIARKLSISEHTVKFHLNGILAKLDADTRTEAVVSALRRGLVML
jgi:DNA-binding NarL/FixJ family response regulator